MLTLTKHINQKTINMSKIKTQVLHLSSVLLNHGIVARDKTREMIHLVGHKRSKECCPARLTKTANLRIPETWAQGNKEKSN